MVSIRPFEESDNATLLNIEKLCFQGNEKYAWGVDKSPDIIARYKMYDNWNVLVAEEEDEIAGWIGWTVKEDPIQNKKYAYLAEVMIHPEFRRKGIATKLTMEAEKNAKEIGSSYAYCGIFKPNDSSRILLERLGYSNMRELRSSSISVYKRADIAQEFKIERINKNEISDVVDLINDYYKGRAHFVPYTPASFESYVNRIPAYGLENFWVVKDEGKIVACAGLWDTSALEQVCIARGPFAMKVMGRIFGFLSLFAKMPKIPAEGEYFKVYFITDHAFNPKSPDAMLNLIRHFNNILFDGKRYFLAVTLDPDDPLFEIIKKFKPQIDYFYIFARSFERELPDFSSFYLDIRDAIL